VHKDGLLLHIRRSFPLRKQRPNSHTLRPGLRANDVLCTVKYCHVNLIAASCLWVSMIKRASSVQGALQYRPARELVVALVNITILGRYPKEMKVAGFSETSVPIHQAT